MIEILILILVLLFIVTLFFAVAGLGMLWWNLMSIGISFMEPIGFWISSAMLITTMIVVCVGGLFIAILSD